MTPPLVVRSRADLDAALAPHRATGADVALVPTMGALHDGHAALLRRARSPSAVVVCSVFVNPTQFGRGEDLARYPRDLDADLDRCAREGVEIVFAPDVDTVYPEGLGGGVAVDPGPLGDQLEGAVRPGHFRGVLTVVAKLFGIVRPTTAVFGAKDYQQLVLVRRMARELFLGVQVLDVETVREPDGLALSSRNAYLSPAERRLAPVLANALAAGAQREVDGAAAVAQAARAVLAVVPDLDVDYLVVADPDLGPVPEVGVGRLLVAARLGRTRLLDNTAVHLGGR